MTSKQSANAVVMIRPNRFYPNPETAQDNTFQQEAKMGDNISVRAQTEFDRAVNALRAAGVAVHVFPDTPAPDKPDAVFPNNWFSTHQDGRVALYPMYSPLRRAERRLDLIDHLKELYQVGEVVDYSPYEEWGLYLEGTGSLVLDRVHRVAYVSLSRRAQLEPLQKFCEDFGYEPMTFESQSEDGLPIYHTNVMLCLGTDFALVGLDLIQDHGQRQELQNRLESTGRTLIRLDRDQINNFAGNGLELHNKDGKLLVLSDRALAALRDDQRATIERFARLLPLALPTIELAGGSARCMLATIHLPPRAL